MTNVKGTKQNKGIVPHRGWALAVWTSDNPRSVRKYFFTTVKDATQAQELLTWVTDGSDPDPMFLSSIEPVLTSSKRR